MPRTATDGSVTWVGAELCYRSAPDPPPMTSRHSSGTSPSTCRTARSAARRSAGDSTRPWSSIAASRITTRTRLPSRPSQRASNRRTSSLAWSPAGRAGTVIRLMTPRTPTSRDTAASAATRSPSRSTLPLRDHMAVDHFRADTVCGYPAVPAQNARHHGEQRVVSPSVRGDRVHDDHVVDALQQWYSGNAALPCSDLLGIASDGSPQSRNPIVH